MGWPGDLQLNYRRDGDRTIAHDRHRGPLRVLQRLYPEGERICHHVLVHPPGGLVGGDRLNLTAQLGAGSHALITTPGATRFYRSLGEPAEQHVSIALEAGARLDWLPLETIAYDGCRAVNHQRFDLAPGAAMFGWDLLALGLPAGGERWQRGQFHQHLEIPGLWLEQAKLDASDDLLLRGATGWNDQRALGTLWFCAGEAVPPALAEQMLDQARALISAAEPGTVAGATGLRPSLLVLRALGPRVEPVFKLMQSVWLAWRTAAWGLAPAAPRIWRT